MILRTTLVAHSKLVCAVSWYAQANIVLILPSCKRYDPMLFCPRSLIYRSGSSTQVAKVGALLVFIITSTEKYCRDQTVDHAALRHMIYRLISTIFKQLLREHFADTF